MVCFSAYPTSNTLYRLILLFRPVVDEANRKAPAFARIFKEMIIVTDPKRPFPRAPKGTVLKKQLMTLYEETLDQLYVSSNAASLLPFLSAYVHLLHSYVTVENSTNAKDTRPPHSWAIPDIETWLVDVATAVNDAGTIDTTIDLFQQGYDR